MWLFRLAAVIVACALVGACGFRPMYATYKDGSIAEDLNTIYVAAIPDRIGQQLRNELLDRLNPKGQPGDPRYRLHVDISFSDPPRALATNELASRRKFSLASRWALLSPDGKKTLAKATVRSETSYNIVASEYATLVSRRNAEAAAAQDAAERIKTQLALYFADERGKKKKN